MYSFRRYSIFASIIPGLAVLACGPPAADGDAVAGETRPDLVVVSAGLEPDPAIRACLGGPAEVEAREEMEPHVAVHPTDPDHLVAAWMARVRGRPGAILAAASRDGGRTWGRPSALPVSACAGGNAALPAASDPWVSIGPEGRVYVTAMGWKPGDDLDSASVVTVVASSDGGETWEAPIAASTAVFPEFMHDNTAVLADPSVAGRLWISTTRISEEGWPAAVVRSSDGGRTWSALDVAIPRDRAASAPQPVIAGGAVYVFYGHGADGSRISWVRSEDGGASWSEPALVHEGAPVDGDVTYPGTEDVLAVAPDIMHPAADPTTGDLYVAFTTGDPADASRASVWLTASRDAGASWIAPVRVGETGEASWRPTLAVAPGGPAVVTFFRADPAGSNAPAFATEVRSRVFTWTDSGELAATEAGTIDRFDWAPRADGSYFLGDYHGLAASARTAVAVYARSVDQGARVVASRIAPP